MAHPADKCCRRGAPRLTTDALAAARPHVPAWDVDAMRVTRTFKFPDYYRTIAFVNAVAWVAHAEDHHPDLVVGYSSCTVTLSTHDAGGVTENDIICAAKIDRLGV